MADNAVLILWHTEPAGDDILVVRGNDSIIRVFDDMRQQDKEKVK